MSTLEIIDDQIPGPSRPVDEFPPTSFDDSNLGMDPPLTPRVTRGSRSSDPLWGQPDLNLDPPTPDPRLPELRNLDTSATFKIPAVPKRIVRKLQTDQYTLSGVSSSHDGQQPGSRRNVTKKSAQRTDAVATQVGGKSSGEKSKSPINESGELNFLGKQSSRPISVPRNAGGASGNDRGNARPGGPGCRGALNDLIENCQDLAEKQGDVHDEFKRNIARGSKLFEFLSRHGAGPGDMLVSFLHTQTCSALIKLKSLAIGNSSSGFKIEEFTDRAKEKNKNHMGEFSGRKLIKFFSDEAAKCCKTAPFLSSMIGSFDKEKVSTGPSTKEKKQRGPPRKKDFDESLTASTQHEEVNFGDGRKRSEDEQRRNPENQKQELFNALKDRYKKDKEPVNLFDFALKKDFSATVQTLFYTAFLVRDGYIEMTCDPGKNYNEKKQTGKPGDAGLVIKPVRPPVQKSLLDPNKENGGMDRNQRILSFNSRMFKAMNQAFVVCATTEDANANPQISTN